MMDRLLFILLFCFVIASCRQSEKAPLTQEQPISVSESTYKEYEVLLKEEAQTTNTDCQDENETPTLGIGLVSAPAIFELFHDSLLTKRYVRWNTDSSETPSNVVCSKFYFPDYSIFHFVCLQETSRYYKVLANADQVKYFPKTKDYRFETWEEYILNSFGIRRKTGDLASTNTYKQEVKQAPNKSSKSIEIPKGHEMFCPQEVTGDWVKVTYDCFYNKERNPYEGEPCHTFIQKCKEPVTGWLKWREGNQVLIDILLMP
ncbi:hypothetical protein [Nibribacter koreensis]|uniref:Lipoprotein n=1 Tax=Nibribacter koreensis TaxID=1084519 RepID=A0ABP8FTD4_9BACT